ncbi:EXPA23 [Linum grandiflorum]
MASFMCFLLGLVVFVGSSLDGIMGSKLDSLSLNNDWYTWQDAHATFYGDMSGRDTINGACGYGDLFQKGYGLQTAALSTPLFNGGLTCGACYVLNCVNDQQWKGCYKNAKPIQITATNHCPPGSTGGWCDPPKKHFDLSMPMFVKLAPPVAGVVHVQYRRVRCGKPGGVKFLITGNPTFNLVLVYNVGGVGDVKNVRVKGSKTGRWLQMSRNWGQNWQSNVVLRGQRLSFQVVTSDGAYRVFNNVVPWNWQFGQTFDGKINF